MTKPEKHLYEFGPFRLDPTERLLLRDGEPVPLEPKVFDTLVLLIRNSGRLLRKDELMSGVWPDAVVEEGSLTRNISTLRRALGDGENGLRYIETVPRLYRQVRPQAKYRRSLELLRIARDQGLVSKTGMMLGLGEEEHEVDAVLNDLVAVGCDILTLGQYLQPTANHLPVARWVHPDEFAAWKTRGEARGLRHVESGPLVRSSYHAEKQVRAHAAV